MEFSPDQLIAYLREDTGLSENLIADWVASGSLDSTFDTSVAMPKLDVPRKRPSQR